MKLSSKSMLAIVAVGVLSLPAIATAGVKSSQVNENQVVITYQVADLKTPEGRATLEREIRGAADKVCGTRSYSEVRSLAIVAAARSCYHEAVTDAMANLGTGSLQITAR